MDINLFSLLGIEIWVFVILGIAFLGIWIYLSIAIRESAKKIGIEKKWANIVWIGGTIPYVMANMTKKTWWPTIVLPVLIFVFLPLGNFSNLFSVFGILTAVIFIGYMIYLKWHICELRFVHGWWALFSPLLMVVAILLSVISDNLYGISLALVGLTFIWYLVLWGILAWSE